MAELFDTSSKSLPRGGARPGAGRKPLTATARAVRVLDEAAEALAEAAAEEPACGIIAEIVIDLAGRLRQRGVAQRAAPAI